MIRTLLLTGAHNHDWRRSAPFCKGLLERSGRFSITISEDPGPLLNDPASLRDVDLIFLDYNSNALWPEPARANFERAIAGGVGLVVLHGSNNAFKTGWPAFEAMCGLVWRDGTGHGQFHEFHVTIVHHDHPITRGLDDFRTTDELYHRLVNTQGVDYTVLAGAFSHKSTGGSGRFEPVILITQFGKGRVFHHALGHVWPGDPNGAYRGASMIAFENQGFQRTLLRGSEWAATGAVTL